MIRFVPRVGLACNIVGAHILESTDCQAHLRRRHNLVVCTQKIHNLFTVKFKDHSVASKEIKRLLQFAIYHTQFSTLCRVISSISSYGLQSERIVCHGIVAEP